MIFEQRPLKGESGCQKQGLLPGFDPIGSTANMLELNIINQKLRFLLIQKFIFGIKHAHLDFFSLWIQRLSGTG